MQSWGGGRGSVQKGRMREGEEDREGGVGREGGGKSCTYT